MQAYRYEALAADGRAVAGIVEADTPRQARSRLRAQGLLPAVIVPVVAGADGRSRRTPVVRAAELSFLTSQLASLMEAGLTLEQALATQIEASAEPATREVLADIKADIAGGSPLSAALARHPGSFPEFYRALIGAAEASGAMTTVLEHLAHYLESREALKQKAGLALLYPALVTLVAVAVVLGLVTYVVPQVVQVFSQSRQALPLLTRLLIGLADFLNAGWPWLVAGLAGLVAAARLALRSDSLKLRWHSVVLRLPGIGALVRADNAARLAGTLGILVQGGVPPFAALGSGVQVMGNLAMRTALLGAIEHVREGVGLARALALAGVFPPLLVHLVASGEASGRLAAMLRRAALLEAAMLERRLAIIMTVLGPLLILLMGAAVLAIVLAILLPIMEINQLVR
jgi:general secretion pathway protein F